MIFHENCLLADNSHDISFLIFFRKLRKMSQNLSSAAVVIGALRVNFSLLGNFAGFFLSSADFFFQNQLFRKILSGIQSECQTVWIQTRPDILSGLIKMSGLITSRQ